MADHKKFEDWINQELPAFHASAWIGAIFIYLINFGTTKFNDIYTDKKAMRNMWVGWGVQLAFWGVVIYFALAWWGFDKMR